jgi:hypothetical protein
MIADTLENLRQYIISEVGENCDIGNKDIAADQYPFIQILGDGAIPIFYDTEKLALANVTGTLRISDLRGNDIRVYEVFEKLLKKINQFETHEGHRIELGDEATPEYTDNNYIINVPYVLRFAIQDS